jgi:hypothetical protein
LKLNPTRSSRLNHKTIIVKRLFNSSSHQDNPKLFSTLRHSKLSPTYQQSKVSSRQLTTHKTFFLFPRMIPSSSKHFLIVELFARSLPWLPLVSSPSASIKNDFPLVALHLSATFHHRVYMLNQKRMHELWSGYKRSNSHKKVFPSRFSRLLFSEAASSPTTASSWRSNRQFSFVSFFLFSDPFFCARVDNFYDRSMLMLTLYGLLLQNEWLETMLVR